MKACLYFLPLLLVAAPARAAERLENSILMPAPEKIALPKRSTLGRGPASLPSVAAKNRALFDHLKPGDTVIIQNSFPGWEDELAEVTAKYDDGSVRIRLANGKKGRVKATVLAETLSPESADGCGESHGVRVCKGENVFYPARSTSLEIPEAPVSHVFENGVLTVRDGADFVLDWKQVGKSVDCSPQKENICVGDHVHADGYKKDQPISFEGEVEKIYSHGVVLVRIDGLWRFPIDVAAVQKRIAVEESNPAVMTEKDLPTKLPGSVKVAPEIEPRDVEKADHVDDAR